MGKRESKRERVKKEKVKVNINYKVIGIYMIFKLGDLITSLKE